MIEHENAKSIALAAELCRQSLKELDMAKEKALKSLQQFVTLTSQSNSLFEGHSGIYDDMWTVSNAWDVPCNRP